MKKIVSLVLAVSMVFSMFASVFAATTKLSDIADTKYAGSVEALVELGVIDGLPDGTYGPEKKVTRAQLAKMLVICLGLGDSVEALEGKTMFTDVADSHWATGYINAAAQSKVIAGYPDGTFKPEKDVSYAEAVTMVIRALGYGNVVDTEGTWPTSYMLKAVELELLDDMDSPKSGEAALRGNVAILLWNMLRTPMWKITAESEGMGMTSQADALMLNVKFPSYRYVEEATIYDAQISEGEVTLDLCVGYEKVEEDTVPVLASGKVKDIDLPRTLLGMTVSSLIKDYKDLEKATILTLTPKYSLVEGVVTDVVLDEQDVTGLKIDNVEYKFTARTIGDEAITEDDIDSTYVVAEVDGKKVNVIAELKTGGTEVDTIRKMENVIEEDDLVIIDGEWAERKDIEVGDVYTALTIGQQASKYFMVARERVNGEFESFTYDADSEGQRYYFEVDGEEYDSLFQPDYFEYDESIEDYNELVADDIEDEFLTDDESKYFGEDVELALDYLGNVVNVYFGDIKDKEDSDINFYVMTGKNSWYTSTEDGMEWYAKVTGVEGERKENFETNEMLMQALVEGPYKFLTEEFYDAEEDEWDEEGMREALFGFIFPAFVNDEDRLEVPTEEELLKQYLVDTLANDVEDLLNDDSYLNDEDAEYEAPDFEQPVKVTDSTYVFTIRAVIDDDEVVGIEVDVTEGVEALEGVKEAMIAVAYDDEKDELANVAKYVFVTEDSKTTELSFGLVEKYTTKSGIQYVIINGETYEIDDENKIFPEIGSYASYRNTEGVVIIAEELSISDVSDDVNLIVEKVEDGMITFVENTALLDAAEVDFGVSLRPLDVDRESVIEAFEDYTFVLGNAGLDKDYNVEFYTDSKLLGEGVIGVTVKKDDRLIVAENDNVIVIIRGLDTKEAINDGVYGD